TERPRETSKSDFHLGAVWIQNLRTLVFHLRRLPIPIDSLVAYAETQMCISEIRIDLERPCNCLPNLADVPLDRVRPIKQPFVVPGRKLRPCQCEVGIELDCLLKKFDCLLVVLLRRAAKEEIPPQKKVVRVQIPLAPFARDSGLQRDIQG